MTRRDWWIGIAVLTVAIFIHAAWPRYAWLPVGGTIVRTDRWTGRADLGQWNGRRWAESAAPLTVEKFEPLP